MELISHTYKDSEFDEHILPLIFDVEFKNILNLDYIHSISCVMVGSNSTNLTVIKIRILLLSFKLIEFVYSAIYTRIYIHKRMKSIYVSVCLSTIYLHLHILC